MEDDSDPPADAYEQARRAFEIVLSALAEAGASAEDVVRVRMFITAAEHMAGVSRAYSEVFAASKPAATAVIVQLLDERWLVEVEADAIVDS